MRDTMLGRMPQLALIPALALVLTSCGLPGVTGDDPDADYVAVCTDPATSARVDDDRCNGAPTNYTGIARTDSASTYMWYYLPTDGGYSAPPVGQRVTRGQYTAPRPAAAGGSVPKVARSGSVPTGGGAVVRGGLGVSAGGGKSGGS